MRIPATLYFSCWSLICLTFLALGFKALDQQELTNIPQFLVYIFKLFLAISLCQSSYYALIHHQIPKGAPIAYHTHAFFTGFQTLLLVTIFFGGYPLWMVLIHTILGVVFIIFTLTEDRFALSVNFFVRVMTLSLVDGRIFATLVMLVAFMTMPNADIEQGEDNNNNSQAAGVESSARNEVMDIYKKMETVKFAEVMFGSILFQNYVKFMAFSHVLAFLYFAAAWLGCLALAMASVDHGVFNFLISNVIIGCTVNHFGIHGPMWFVYGACIVLFALRRVLGNVRLLRERNEVSIKFTAVD